MTWGSVIALVAAVVLYFLSEYHRKNAAELSEELEAFRNAMVVLIVSQKAVDETREANDIPMLKAWLERQAGS